MSKTKHFFLTLQRIANKNIRMEHDCKDTIEKMFEFISTQKILRKTPKFNKEDLLAIYFIEFFNFKNIDDVSVKYRHINKECLSEFKEVTTDRIVGLVA